MRIWLTTLLFALFVSNTFAQSEREFINQLNEAVNDSIRVERLTDLGYALEFSDSAKALKYFRNALSLSRKTGNNDLISMSLSSFGNFYIDYSMPTIARMYHRQAMEYSYRSGKPAKVGRTFCNLGNVE